MALFLYSRFHQNCLFRKQTLRTVLFERRKRRSARCYQRWARMSVSGGAIEPQPQPEAEAEVCAICLQALRRATRASACQHYFCRACLREWLKQNASCPICRTAARPFTRTANDAIIEEEEANPDSLLAWRASIYRRRLRVFTPFSSSVSAAQLQRPLIRRWIERELQALHQRVRMPYAIDAVIAAVKAMPEIGKDGCLRVLDTLLRDVDSERFLHELICRAGSSLDMRSYDRYSKYQGDGGARHPSGYPGT